MYALLTQSSWVGVPAMVNIPLSLLAITLPRRARQQSREHDLSARCLAPEAVAPTLDVGRRAVG